MEEGAWDDFANNLATDLAPLITLFGEQVTKQYLSESVGFLDTLIFALAPLGILTAVVSAIRVSGSPSLRAFIGRAQEGPGNAEVELLSCTSETTAEIWNDGGIARVFGKPNLLEVAVDSKADPEIDFVYKATSSWKEQEIETSKYDPVPTARATYSELSFKRSSPNLSLNKGIKRRPEIWFYGATILGFVMVCGVLIFGAITVYLAPSRFQRDGKPVMRYSYPCFLVGTMGVDIGMFLCARIIEQATLELFYRPTEDGKSVIYWLQPGGQKVGDQVFNAFAGSFNDDPKSQKQPYIKSIKNPKTPRASILWLAVGVSMGGFVFQFVGARGLHASVTLAWLGSTLLMTIIRAALRTQRMGEAENLMMQPEMENLPKNFIYGHELDWFALYLKAQSEESPPSQERPFRLITNINFQSSRSPHDSVDEKSMFGKSVLKTRARLAELTGPEQLDWEDFPVRKIAQQLKTAIEGTMERLRSSLPSNSNFKTEIEWPIYIQERRNTCFDGENVEHHALNLKRSHPDAQWQVNVLELEAVLGLWTRSLLHKSSENRTGQRNARILYESSFDEKFYLPQIVHWIPRAELGWRKPETQRENNFTWVTNEYFDSRQNQDVPFELHGSTFYLCRETDNSLLQVVAHDLFISFLSAALAKDITLNNAIDNATKLTPTSDNMYYRESQRFLIYNPEIDGWAQSFEESHLGSREDAYMCILPVLYRNPHMPMMHGGLKLVRELVEEYKRKREFASALAMLDWIISTFELDKKENKLSSYRKTVVEILGVLGCPHQGWAPRSYPDKNTYIELQTLHEQIGLDSFQKLVACSWEKATEVFGPEIYWEDNVPEIINSNVKEEQIDEILEGTDSSSPGRSNESGREALSKVIQIREPKHVTDERKDLPHSELLRSALCWAASNKQRIVFYLLLEKGDAIESRDNGGLTYLMWASQNGYYNVVEFLLDENAEIEAAAPHSARGTTSSGFPTRGMTSIMLAVWEGHDIVATLLIQRGACLEKRDDENHTVLMVAADSGASNVVKLLLDKGVAVNATRKDGKTTALLYAARNGHEETLALLIAAGVNIDIRDSWGRTALMYAVLYDMEGIIKILLKNNADINVKDQFGKTALEFVTPTNLSYERVQQLFRHCVAQREAVKKEEGTGL